MKISRVLLSLLAISFAGAAWAQKPVSYGAELIIVEDAIEALRVMPVLTADNTVIEVRVFECESCAVKIYPPETNIKFVHGKERVKTSTAAEIAKSTEAVAFINIVTKKVSSVKYHVESASGDSL